MTRLIPVCGACERGGGGECHTPGCSFWMHDAPTEKLQYHGIPVLPDVSAVASLTKASSLNQEGKRILQLLITKYGMQEDKALQLIKEVLSVLLSPSMNKATPAPKEEEAVGDLRRKLRSLQKKYDDLLESLNM